MTLSLHRIHVSADFVKLFERNTTHLRSLYTSSMISGEKKMFRALLTMILSLSHLHTCQLRLAIGTGPIPPASVLKSPIQRLKLVGPTEVCVLDRLSVLLGYLPLLQSLSIVAQKLAWTSTPSKSDLSIPVPISTFTLKIQVLDIPVYLFLQFVSSVMPQLETLTIICLFAQPNHSYLDRIQWNALLLDSLPNLRQVILMIHRASTVDESIWNKKCELLGKNFARRRVALRIIGKT